VAGLGDACSHWISVVYLELDTSLLDAAQAACVALPAAGVPAALLRLGGGGRCLLNI
jgi:hypothetical protein